MGGGGGQRTRKSAQLLTPAPNPPTLVCRPQRGAAWRTRSWSIFSRPRPAEGARATRRPRWRASQKVRSGWLGRTHRTPPHRTAGWPSHPSNSVQSQGRVNDGSGASWAVVLGLGCARCARGAAAAGSRWAARTCPITVVCIGDWHWSDSPRLPAMGNSLCSGPQLRKEQSAPAAGRWPQAIGEGKGHRSSGFKGFRVLSRSCRARLGLDWGCDLCVGAAGRTCCGRPPVAGSQLGEKT
jgi:hypothetical protein